MAQVLLHEPHIAVVVDEEVAGRVPQSVRMNFATTALMASRFAFVFGFLDPRGRPAPSLRPPCSLMAEI